MRYIDIEDHLQQVSLNKGRSKELVNVYVAMQSYSNLKGFSVDSQVLICSADINEFATHVEFRFDEESRLVAMPYIEEKGMRVHSNPAAFFVGERNSLGFGVWPYVSWQHYLEQYNVSPEAVKLIRSYLDNHAPVDYR